MNITFIGNCQTASLCFYFQSLLSGKDYNVSWILYGDEFRQHLGSWIEKCQNKILEYEQAIEQITRSDIIIYQEISTEKSLFCNTATLQEHSKESCIFIKIPSIFLDYNHYSESIQGLEKREHTNNVDIIVSDILKKYPNDQEVNWFCNIGRNTTTVNTTIPAIINHGLNDFFPLFNVEFVFFDSLAFLFFSFIIIFAKSECKAEFQAKYKLYFSYKHNVSVKNFQKLFPFVLPC